ncbi:MAG: tape measure protein [Blastocatellia bacterium]
MPIEIGRLEAKITGDDRDFQSKMKRADQAGKQTARSIGQSFSNLKIGGQAFAGLTKAATGAGGAISSAFAGIGTELLTGALTKVVAGFSLAIKTGLDFNKMMEGAEIVFANLTGSADNAVKHLNGLKEFAKSSPFDLPDLIQASARMQAFGFASESVLPNLKNLQNAAALAAGTSGNFTESLGGIVTALGQMRANTRVSAEEMNQLTQRGIPAWELLAQKIGKSVAETRKLSEEGRLRGAPAADALLEAFGEGKFAGLGEKLAKTTLGKESNLRDALTQQAGDAAKDTARAYNAALDEAMRQVKTPEAASLGKKLNEPIAAGLQIATDISSGLVTAKDIGRALIPTAKDTVVELGTLLKDGLASAWSVAGQVASGAAEYAGVSMGDAAIKGTKSSLKSESPSRVYIQIGEDAASGFEIGFENGKKKILARQEAFVAELKKQYERANKEFADAFDEASKKTGLPKELLMGVASRETNMRNIVGDRGRGAGVMQVDIGTDAAFKASGAWKDATASIIRGAEVLKEKFDQLIKLAGEQVTINSRAGEKFKFEVPKLEGDKLKEAAVAAYNSGLFAARNVSLGRSVDASTTGRDYSADVLKRAEIFKQFADAAQQSAPSFEKIAQTAPRARETVLQLANLASPVEMLARVRPGQVIQGGGVSMHINARRDEPLKTISPKEAGLATQLDMTTTKAAAALKAMAEAAKPVPQAVDQAARKTQTWAEKMIDAGNKVSGAAERLSSFKERLGQGFDDLIGALVTGSDRWRDVARNIAVDFFNSLASEMMLAATGGKYGSLGGLLGGVVGGLFGGLFGGGKASGGTVMAGTPYLVGERGPELFMPNRSGSIVPANQTKQMMGGGQNITVVNNFNITAPGGRVAPETQQQIATRAGQGIQAAIARNG